MKRVPFFFFILIFVLPNRGMAADWYFAEAKGGASAQTQDGKTPATPLTGPASLNAKLAAARPGDRFFLKRGDRFVGSITLADKGISSAPILITGFGTGADPVITDLKRVPSWKSAGKNLWSAVVDVYQDPKTFDPSMMLVLSGRQLPLGRYPNADAPWGGFLPIGRHEGKWKIMPSGLPQGIDWTGAILVARENNWILDRLLVKSHVNGVLSFDSESSYEPRDDYGFFIQNHPAALDREGEWCFNRKTREILLYSERDPNKEIYEYPSGRVLVDARKSAYVSLEGVELVGSYECMVDLDESRGISLKNCAFRLAGRNVANGKAFLQDFTFSGNRVEDTQNNVIRFENAKNVVIENNTIRRTATVAGMGAHGDNQYTVIMAIADNLVIEGNRIENSGYQPVYFMGDDVLVKHNYISGYGTVKDDVAGIYTYSDGHRAFKDRVIVENLVRNGIGAPNGKPAGERLFAEGIYLDDRVNDVIVERNIVSGIANAGIYIHNANGISVKDNTVVDASIGLKFWHDMVAAEYPIRDVEVSGNVIFAARPGQTMVFIGNIVDDVEPGIEFNGNSYLIPFAKPGEGIFDIELKGRPPVLLNPVQWISSSGRDPEGTVSGKNYTVKKTDWTGTDAIKSGSFENGLPDWGYWSMYGKGKVESSKLTVPAKTFSTARMFFQGASSKEYSNLAFWSQPYPVSREKTYRLRFKARAGVNGMRVSFLTRKNADPYTPVSEEVFFTLDGDLRDYELIFSPKADESNARAEFQIYETDAAGTGKIADAFVELTSVEMKEIRVSDIPPDAFYRFEPNFGESGREIDLQGPWLDAWSRPVTGRVKIAPYSAGVFLKAD